MSVDKVAILESVFEEKIKKYTDDLKNIIVAENVEILKAIESLSTRIEILEKLNDGKRKVNVRNSVPKSIPMVRKPKPITFIAWFKKKFEDEKFRLRIISDDINALIQENKNIQESKTQEQKQIRICTFIWNFIRKNKDKGDSLYKRLEGEYTDEKNSSDEINQQEVEQNTDDEDQPKDKDGKMEEHTDTPVSTEKTINEDDEDDEGDNKEKSEQNEYHTLLETIHGEDENNAHESEQEGMEDLEDESDRASPTVQKPATTPTRGVRSNGRGRGRGSKVAIPKPIRTRKPATPKPNRVTKK